MIKQEVLILTVLRLCETYPSLISFIETLIDLINTSEGHSCQFLKKKNIVKKERRIVDLFNNHPPEEQACRQLL